MLLKIFQYIRGYLRIRVSGNGAERFLNACRHRGIQLWALQPVGNSYEMNISIRGFRQVKPIVRKTGTKIVIVRRIGFPFFLNRYRKRRLFFVGAAGCFILIYTLSRFIWSIDIRGNLTRTDETLLKFLATKDIQNGMRVREVDCAKIVKDIRKEYNDIIWVSASIDGSKLIIQIKENEDVIVSNTSEEGVSSQPQTNGGEDRVTVMEPVDIVADRDCVITSIVTRRGVPMVKEGAEVKAGDVLVSGRVPVNNDAGEIISYHYQEADADITGQTNLTYEDSQELVYDEKKLYDIKKQEQYLRIGNWRIVLGSVKNKYEHFEGYSEETQVKLFDNFYLPVFYGTKSVSPYATHEKKYEQEEYQSLLSNRFFRYCEDLEKKRVEIIQNDVKIYTESDEAKARGTLIMKMPIGEKKPSVPLEITKTAEENEQAGE